MDDGEARILQICEVAPWLRDADLLSPDLEARVRAGQEIADPLARTLNVRRTVVRKLFRDWKRGVGAGWEDRPLLLSGILERTPEPFWPEGEPGWDEWGRLLGALETFGLDELTLEAAFPVLVSARARDRRNKYQPIRPDTRWINGVRSLLEWIGRLAPMLDIGERSRVLTESMLRDRVRTPVAWLHEIETRWRKAFKQVHWLADDAPRAVIQTVPVIEHGAWTLRPLRSKEDLEREGKRMHNCLGEYAGHLLNAHALYFALSESGAPRANIEIRLFDRAPSLGVGDVRGPGNAPAEAGVHQFAQALMHRLQPSLGIEAVHALRKRCRQQLRGQLPEDWRAIERLQLLFAFPSGLRAAIIKVLRERMG